MTNPFNGDPQNQNANPYGSFPESSPETHPGAYPADNQGGYGAFPNSEQNNMAGLDGTNINVPGLGSRFLSFLVDFIVVCIIGAIFTFTIAGGAISEYRDAASEYVNSNNPNAVVPEIDYGPIAIASLLALIAIMAYRSIMDAKLGGTLGRMATGTKVINPATGGNISIGSALLRSAWWPLGGILSNIPMIGLILFLALYIVIAVQISRDPLGQHSFDKWAKAQVVNK